MRHFIESLRAHLGGMALGLGCIGIFLFALGMLANAAISSFMPGMDGHTSEQIYAAEDHAFWQSFTDRLLPLFVLSIGLIAYGFYEVLAEKRRKP